LTSETGSIRKQVNRLIEEKTYEILNDNEGIVATFIAASLSVIEQDAVGLFVYYFQCPRQPGESREAFFHRFSPFWIKNYRPIFNKIQAELAQRLSDYFSSREDNNYGVVN
jgi:hypothetical protein